MKKSLLILAALAVTALPATALAGEVDAPEPDSAVGTAVSATEIPDQPVLTPPGELPAIETDPTAPPAIPDEPILTPPGELPTLDPSLPNQTAPTPDPNGYLLDPPGPLPSIDPMLPNELNPDGRDVRCPDGPQLCVYDEYVAGGYVVKTVEDVADIGTPPVADDEKVVKVTQVVKVAKSPVTEPAVRPNLPKTGY